MGAFKFRGAFNALSRFDASRSGAASSRSRPATTRRPSRCGRAARHAGVIVMPHDAPAAKVAATRGYGGEVVVYDRYSEDREAIGRSSPRSAA